MSSAPAARQDPRFLEALSDLEVDVGPGAFDVHTPLLLTPGEIQVRLQAYAQHIPPRRLWVNPDCGLKTPRWEEVEANLKAMVAAARALRAQWEGRDAEGA